MKSVRIRKFSGPYEGKYGPGKLQIRTIFTLRAIAPSTRNLRGTIVRVTFFQSSLFNQAILDLTHVQSL